MNSFDDERRELALHVQNLAERLRHLDIELSPFNRREAHIRFEIKRTHVAVADADAPRQYAHGTNHDGVQVAALNLSPPAVEARMGLWFELDKVRDIAGPTREARRVCAIEHRSAKAALERLVAANAQKLDRR